MVERAIKLISAQFNVPVEDLTEDISFVDDLNADSIELMEMIMNLEEEFGVEIDEEKIADIKTIGDVVEYIESLE